ncbi:hypothetical protein RJT17_36880 [Streptomyces sp. P5-A9]|uniref:hypothetical protein n=1 Tax=Streptomyces sp. P5-A9 TaxID=3071730 RepID=UPI002FCBE0E8
MTLDAGLVNRGQRIIGHRRRLGERPAADLAHRPVLPLHRLSDARDDPGRHHGLTARLEGAAVAIRRRAALHRHGGRGRQDVHGADVGAGHRRVGRCDQLRRAPAPLRAHGRSVGHDVQASALHVERRCPHASGELGRGRSEDGVELGEDASTGGRGDHAALSHHAADRAAQSQWLSPVAPSVVVVVVVRRFVSAYSRI